MDKTDSIFVVLADYEGEPSRGVTACSSRAEADAFVARHSGLSRDGRLDEDSASLRVEVVPSSLVKS